MGPMLIMMVVRWYLRHGLSSRDVEELLAERGVEVEPGAGGQVAVALAVVDPQPGGERGVGQHAATTGRG